MPGPDASGFVLRAARPGDAQAVADLWVRCWLDTYPNEAFGITRAAIAERMASRNAPEGVARLRTRLARDEPGRAAWVAEASGTVVGFAFPATDADGVQHVGALYVDAAWHGRGPGQALLDAILAWRDPARPLVLSVASYNERAIRFYRRNGFVDAGAEAPCHADALIPAIGMIHRA